MAAIRSGVTGVPRKRHVRRYALPYLACYLTSFLHTTLERASRGKHVRLLSTGSAPPRAKGAIGARAKRAFFTCTPLTTHPPAVLTARASSPPRSLIQHRKRVRRCSSSAHKSAHLPGQHLLDSNPPKLTIAGTVP
jgi:hypothetical protein